MSDILQKICADKKEHIEVMKQKTSLDDLKHKITDMPVTRGFKNKISTYIQSGKTALIAEVKKASPSAGLIRADFNPVDIALAYQEADAACLSVLTDVPYFQGQDHYLEDIRQTCALPLLRKDFMLDPYQIYESRALGADCILLIMSALKTTEAAALYALAKELGMDVLVEVHDKAELERALSFGPDMIGVNNRNLKIMKTDLQTSKSLAASIPEDVIAISESGIYEHNHIASLKEYGFHTFLVGESLMRQDDVTLATRHLLGV